MFFGARCTLIHFGLGEECTESLVLVATGKCVEKNLSLEDLLGLFEPLALGTTLGVRSWQTPPVCWLKKSRNG